MSKLAQPVRMDNPQDGTGYIIRESLFEEGTFPEKVSLYAKMTLAPHSELGFHVHEGNQETYFVLEGEALYNDNGKTRMIGPGEVTRTFSGCGHGIKNDSDQPFVFIALINEN